MDPNTGPAGHRHRKARISPPLSPAASPQPRPRRNTGVDVLRIVSIVAVVAGHAYGPRLPGGEYLEIWRMPLFFFLTGYFWTRGRPWATDVRGRFRSLMVPYLVWAALMSCLLYTSPSPRDVEESRMPSSA